MLWLFGEIWLWLLLAFVLGVALAAFVLASVRRRSTESAPSSPDTAPAGEGADSATQHIPRVEDTERTQFIRRAARPQLRFGEPPSPTRRQTPSPWPRQSSHPGGESDTESTQVTSEVPDVGRRQGVLPVSEWHVRNEWPDERDIAVAEEDRPRRER